MGPGGGQSSNISLPGDPLIGAQNYYSNYFSLQNDLATLQKIQEIVKRKQKHLQFVFL